MINKDILKNIVIITTIVSLFFTFSFLVGFSNTGTEEIIRTNDGIILLDDSEEGDTGKGLNIEDLINLVQEATSKHFAILQEVLENAPASARKGIERAIEVSSRGSIRAVEALNKVKSSNNKNNGQKNFHIISSSNRGGTIDPKGIQFSQGETISFEITVEEGYTLTWVKVDNKKLEALSSYSFDNVDSNHTIHAHFKKIRNSSNQDTGTD